MTKEDWKSVKQIRIHVVEDEYTWGYAIHCPLWLYWLLEKLEK